jgi:hypothetical protein
MAAIAMAILKYRLYDIDRLISRTLTYGLLTAILGLGYVGAVLVLGQVSSAVGGETPSWAVAGATLVVAALFQPAPTSHPSSRGSPLQPAQVRRRQDR